MLSRTGIVFLAFLALAPICAPLRAEPLSPPDSTEPADASDFAVEDWSLHGQLTAIVQGYPTFRSPYEGANSLAGSGQVRETVTATAFLGARLWPGAALYVNPEIAQGFGLSTTLGVAGFPNGEATKVGSAPPKIYLARLFLREVIGFGGGTEDLEAAPNQLAERVDVSRLTLTLGGVAASDFFDGNTYAHDPRTGFMNWALWESGAWDYPADARGYTYGAAADLHGAAWSLRGGFFLMPTEPNGPNLNLDFVHQFGTLVEGEQRFTLGQRPGAVRALAYLNQAKMGSYFESVALSPVDPSLTATQTKLRHKYGFATSVEQEITEALGAFARLSWNNGTTESFAFTEIDLSAAVGFVLQGSRWGRPDDAMGLAAVVNGLSQQHRRYLAAGGLGIILGDGRLHAGPETIVEFYYSLQLSRPLALTLDEQLVVNPADNRDRGSVSISALRLHLAY